MSRPVSRDDTVSAVCFAASAVIHLTVFLLLLWWGRLFPSQPAIHETYYVEVVNLPTAEPQAGIPAAKISEPAPDPPPAAPQPMSIPVPPPAKAPPPKVAKSVTKPAKPTTGKVKEPAETESAFESQMAKLENARNASREEAVMENLRNKVKGTAGSKPGMPGAGGNTAGSSYPDFIKSRLEDALKVTSSYSSKNPEVFVRLTISAEGKLAKMNIERSSGDAVFEMAVRRAVDLASSKFVPPPNHAVFENGFVFKPKGIASVSSR